MSRSSLRRATLVLLLFTLLTASFASAAERQGPPKVAGPAALERLSRAWSFLVSLWSEEGCHIDPNGRCVTSPVQVHTDTGCHIDPNGRCTP